MMNINNRKRHLFRKAYADMYIKEEKYLQKEDCKGGETMRVKVRSV